MFNGKYGFLSRMTVAKFRKLKANFSCCLNVKLKKLTVKPITDNKDNEITILPYFMFHCHSSLKSASLDLEISFTLICQY